MKNTSLSILLFSFIFAFIFSSCKDNSTGTEDNSPFYPVILKTTDGGINWTSQNIFQGSGQSAYKIKFYNNVIGFVIGNGNLISKTTDSGDTWNNITISQNSNIILRDIAIASENKILIIGLNTLYKSEDGGIIWTSYTFPTSEFPMIIRFADANTGYITGRFEHTGYR